MTTPDPSRATALQTFVSALHAQADRARDRGEPVRASEIADDVKELLTAMETFEAVMAMRYSLDESAVERANLWAPAARRLDAAVTRCRKVLAQPNS